MRVTVGHLKHNYLRLTETFVYSFLANARRFSPLIFTDILHNLDAFPIPCSYLLQSCQIGPLKQNLGSDFEPFIYEFFQKFDYPSCFKGEMVDRNVRLLHAHFGEAGISALHLKKKLGLPLITSFYGIDASRLLRQRNRREAFKRLFKEGDLFLVLGNDMADRLQRAGCPAKKIRIQHLAVDLEQIPYPSRTLPGKNERIVLLYCGRLVAKKGILYALDAFSYLAEKWKTLEFRVVGEGPLRAAAKKKVRRLNLQSRVSLLGALSHSKTLQEMRNAHLFLIPSLTAPNGDMEGTPTVLLEAQASGLPVVSTRHADIPEVVRHTHTGFLVPEKNSGALADRLNHLLQHPERWAEMGQAGRHHIERHYNICKEIVHLENTYAEIVA